MTRQNPDSLFIILLENGNLEDVIRKSFFRELSKLGCFLTNYHGIQPPSQVNYWALTAGSIFDDVVNPSNDDTDLEASNIYDLLDEKKISWKVYHENYPEVCYTGTTDKEAINKDSLYVRKHNPAISFNNIRNNKDRCSRIVDAKQLLKDIILDQLPRFAFYIPNNMNNGHDTSPNFSNDYLLYQWGNIFTDTRFIKNRTVIITYDENGDFERPIKGKDICLRVQAKPIYTLFLGPNIERGEIDEFYTHYDLLRTIEHHFNLGSLGRCDAEGLVIPVKRKKNRLENFIRDIEDAIIVS